VGKIDVAIGCSPETYVHSHGLNRCQNYNLTVNSSRKIMNNPSAAMLSKPKGWVYVISNPSIHGEVKIGFTDRDPQARASELGGTGISQPYFVEYEMHIEGARTVEQKMHKELRAVRVRKDREWFRCTSADAALVIRRVASGREIYETFHREIQNGILKEEAEVARRIREAEIEEAARLRALAFAEEKRSQAEKELREKIEATETRIREHYDRELKKSDVPYLFYWIVFSIVSLTLIEGLSKASKEELWDFGAVVFVVVIALLAFPSRAHFKRKLAEKRDCEIIRVTDSIASGACAPVYPILKAEHGRIFAHAFKNCALSGIFGFVVWVFVSVTPSPALPRQIPDQVVAAQPELPSRESIETPIEPVTPALPNKYSLLSQSEPIEIPAEPVKSEHAPPMTTATAFIKKVRENIGGKLVVSSGTPFGISANFKIVLLPDGNLLSLTLAEGSGDQGFDDAVELAILKSEPFPVPKEPKEFSELREINLVVRNDTQVISE
jgi:T5orf172 domain/TonB C terminal